jgi:hypothetical protein
MLARTPPQSAAYTSLPWTERLSTAYHRRAQEIAQAALDGRTTVLEAVRALVSLAHNGQLAGLLAIGKL